MRRLALLLLVGCSQESQTSIDVPEKNSAVRGSEDPYLGVTDNLSSMVEVSGAGVSDFNSGGAATGVPSFDTPRYCEKIASVGGVASYETEATCRDMEAEARKKLMSRAIPARVYDYCEKIALVGGLGSYETMDTCVDMELEAKSRL